MSDKIEYWMRDLSGAKALITGTDERDRWTVHGWSETTEPGENDQGFVWMTNAETGHAASIPWAAREYWLGRDWAPSPPDEPVNPTKDPALTAVVPVEVPPDGTADAVKEWVGTDPVRAEAALVAEQQRPAPRKTVVEALQHVGQPGSEHGKTNDAASSALTEEVDSDGR